MRFNRHFFNDCIGASLSFWKKKTILIERSKKQEGFTWSKLQDRFGPSLTTRYHQTSTFVRSKASVLTWMDVRGCMRSFMRLPLQRMSKRRRDIQPQKVRQRGSFHSHRVGGQPGLRAKLSMRLFQAMKAIFLMVGDELRKPSSSRCRREFINGPPLCSNCWDNARKSWARLKIGWIMSKANLEATVDFQN